MNSTVDAIKNATAGSSAATRANVLGAQLNKTRALSQARQQADAINAAEDAKAQQFNFMTAIIICNLIIP